MEVQYAWNAIAAISSHLVVRLVDSMMYIPNGVVDLPYCVVQKAFYTVIIAFRALEKQFRVAA